MQRRTQEPLAWLLDNPRTALQLARQTDFLWLRPLDVPKLLAARRYGAEGRLVLAVDDSLGLAGGRFVLEADEAGSQCRPTDASPDVRMGIHTLGALSLGGRAVRVVYEAGLIEELSPGGLDRAERMFEWPIEPWCSTFF